MGKTYEDIMQELWVLNNELRETQKGIEKLRRDIEACDAENKIQLNIILWREVNKHIFESYDLVTGLVVSPNSKGKHDL